ncbi:zinc finger SWIM domain-containing protein 7-like isoform X1 [Schistocerca americana]|uniref:zinc finger SWIM domain-containing protein 7-like isoform X1 n=1 Tax=Schistocerca americana TaxID=7009 RepID=UPI001F4FDB52|nr:zinc finger SWIM domain-containing protein 7-like isoform X1 [Schistocerca americana]XP_049942441.1 zinc finger SWIM domain-containing protein 7-like isoform X1 [Schistocerca serialis cubense]
MQVETENKAIALLPQVNEELLREAEDIFRKHGDFTDDVLLALHSLYGNPFERALELLEKNCVVFLRTTNKLRYVIQVKVTGSSGTPYTVFPSVNYCSCPAYRYHVAGTQTDLTCKHVLAGKLCEIMGKGREVVVSANEMIRILCSAAKLDTK